MRGWRKGVLLLAAVVFVTAFGIYSFAGADRQAALARLAELEAQRASEEFNFQMGIGLSDQLKQGYADLAASAAGVQDVLDWATYRLAEIDYSRDRFGEAVTALRSLAETSKDRTIALEAQLLAAEILESPFNPQRDPEGAEQLLGAAEAKYPGNQRAAVAGLARRSTRLINQRMPDQAAEVVFGKLTGRSFVSPEQAGTPFERAASQKHNKELAKAFRNQALAQGAQHDYAGAYATLNGALKGFPGDDAYDWFTFTANREDLEFQQALALAAQGSKPEAIAALKALAARYPNSHLSLRAQARIAELDPQPVPEPQPSAGNSAGAGTLAPNNDCICGPAALRTALSRLGKEVSLDAVVKSAGTTNEGTTMAGLVAAAQAQGFKAYGLRVSKSDLERLPTPSVALWHDHFVTITAVSATEVSLYDPLAGAVTKTPAEFNALWEGVLLVFAETEAEAVHGLTGAQVLSDAELAALSGRYLCGNAVGGWTPSCSDPCANFQRSQVEADGDMDGLRTSVNRVVGNNYVETAPLVLGGTENTDIEIQLSYNSMGSAGGGITGPGWALSYTDRLLPVNGNLQWIASDGTRATFSRNVDGSFTSPPGNFDTLVENSDGTHVLLLKSLERLYFDASGRLVRREDQHGQGVTVTYDANGQSVQLTDSYGIATTMGYGSNGLLSSLQVGEQRVDLVYDSSNRLTRLDLPVQDPAAGSTRRSISLGYASGYLSSVTNTYGKSMAFSYTSAGQLTSVTNAAGRSRSLGGSFSDYLGNNTSVSWDGQRRVTSVTNALGYTTRYEYTADNKVAAQIDALGNRTTFYYDAYGNRTTVVDALGQQTHYTYNANHQVTSVTDALGRRSTYSYDAQGNLVRIANPLGNTMSYTYDAAGRMTSVTDFAGATSRMTYDSYGRLIELEDAAGGVTVFGYDALGRRTSVMDALGSITRYSYDSYGQITQVTHPDGTTETMQYDGQRLVAKTDRRRNTTRFEYDDLGRVIRVTDPAGGVTAFGYDAQGNQTSVTDPLGRVTTRTYDGLGRVTKVVYPDGLTETFTYNALYLTQKTNTDGTTITYTYDALGRVVREERR